ncbi:hypothetical protein PFICI_02158 [Pestalotiopsis fici W106-1]|uniref:6-phosphogluconate dehydrogenase NADP-binding domain-containing protein n=1 Tax=Pestalotiopsis fici (strain W106-1 / CGMCC3.15140) TaxID=1229662 RepID=W3XDF8_PESFW|nr:uncharacterized protein PFICI_02158 [Pestalotiopsis fici W106-1]ETS84133.1 hypothetical protein PFICI_02158 [Pestalotiopsis fici W106-1]
MALNLQKHLTAIGSSPLVYSNRTLARGDPLKAEGASPVDDFKTVVKSTDIIFTMISDDSILDALVEEATSLENIQGKLFIDTSTVHPSTSSAVAKALKVKGAEFIASPVFGASPMAAAGKLIFAMAGPHEQITRVSPFIQDVMGRQIINMGADVQNSSLLKISGNIFVIGFQELIAEAQVFAEKTGLGTGRMEEFIGSMFGPVLESYSKRMTSGAWAPPLGTPPGFAVSLASKDARHALAIAEEKGTQLPTLATALNRMTKAREYAGESLDSASVYGIARMEAGLPFWSENSRQSN